jgi:curli biogenesis system outer membrane secretion channel CsgG
MRRFVTAVSLVAAALPAFAQKRSVSVQDFDFSAVKTEVQAIFNTQVDLGRGINAMMVNRINNSGKFIVVERNKVASVMKEQDFGASGRVKQGTQARIGQIRGAELTLMGDIVVFGRDDKRRSGVVGGGAAGVGAVVGGRSSEGKAVVVLNYRLVDNESTEILASGEARGESKRTSKGGGVAFLAGGVFGGGAVDLSSSNFAQTIIGEAVMDACDRLAADLVGKASSVPGREIEIEAKVASVNGADLIINAGAAAGVKIGDQFKVFRPGQVVKDPTTGEVLDTQVDEIGTLTISNVRDRIATGSYNGQPAKVGDIVRK